MKKTSFFNVLLIITLCTSFSINLNAQSSSNNRYINRFLELRGMVNDPKNGYFSPDGAPYHSVETFMIEAPDYGHESTSEAYSFWIWMEAMYGRVTGDWSRVKYVWNKMEDQIIPKASDQPNNAAYKSAAPADYMAEHLTIQGYPSSNEPNIPVGKDPIATELTATYGNSDIYGMHWLIDVDNWYGFGNHGDGVSKQSYINTFQRGPQESVFETVPQPAWDNFKYGTAVGGFLPLFGKGGTPSQQWKYTDAPDADARVVQAMFWATQWMKEEGGNLNTLSLDKTKKMGDYLRYSMFDKYFKPMNCQSVNSAGATGYNAMHYLMSWYYAWGGSISAPTAGWAWRIGCSHNHFGYQNPLAAYALSNVTELTPSSATAKSHWTTSLNRQLEFYTWLQSVEGGIAGGATNSWNGVYDAYPAGTPTFYGMGYTENPVYEDPGSNSWFGWQAWSLERVAELYYVSNDVRAKKIMDKWIKWVSPNIHLIGTTDFEIPSGLAWTGKPDTWNPVSPGSNSNLNVTITSFGKDVGITASLARTLMYYAAATQKYSTLDAFSRDMAKELIDRLWTNKDALGIAIAEERGDYSRFFDQDVYIPSTYSGVMPNGDKIKPGIKFKDIRSKYLDDPAYPAVLAAYKSGTKYKTTYHRTWAQMEIAMANADFGFLFPMEGTNFLPSISITSPLNNAFYTAGSSVILTANAADQDGTVSSVDFYANGQKIGSSATAPYSFTWNAPIGTYTIYAIATDNENGTNQSINIKINVGNHAPVAAFNASATTGRVPFVVNFDASSSSDVDGNNLTYSWDFGDGSTDEGVLTSHTYNVVGEYTATLTVNDGKGATNSTTKNFTVKVTCDLNSIFNAPQSAAISTMSVAYSNAYTIGDNGPDVSNVSKLGFNWTLDRNSLALSFNYKKNTGHGYYESLNNYVISKSLNTANPSITFKDSTAGMVNFKGKYYVVTSPNYLVLVSENNSHAIYFSNSTSAPAYCDNASATAVNSVIADKDKPGLLVFPTFAKSYINVNTTSDIERIEIINVQGQVMISKTVQSNETQIPLSQLKNGMYIVKCILRNNSVAASKIIKI